MSAEPRSYRASCQFPSQQHRRPAIDIADAPGRKCLPPSPDTPRPTDDTRATCSQLSKLCPRRDGRPPTRDRLLHDLRAMRAKDVVSELTMGMHESQNERDARVEALWRELDAHHRGELDWKALQHGLKKMDHRQLPKPVVGGPCR